MDQSLKSRLDLTSWDALGAATRRETAAAVAAAVGGELVALVPHSQGGLTHEIAALVVRGARLALIPGGEVRLGWERGRLALDDEQRADWLAGNDEDESFEAYLDYCMTVPRTVRLEPFLLEVVPTPVRPWAERGVAAAAALADEGFRLASDDEWEHALRAGGTSFFRWGTTWPGGVPLPHQTLFAEHLRPNAFGLTYLADPYNVELVAGGDGLRGGDGGGAISAGRPAAEAWAAFASSFFYPDELVARDLDRFLLWAYARRALSLP